MRLALRVVLAVYLFGLSMDQTVYANGKKEKNAPPRAAELPSPFPVHRQLDLILKEFGRLIVGLYLNSDKPCLVDVEVMPLAGGGKEYPVELGIVAREVMDSIGANIITRRTLSPSMLARPYVQSREDATPPTSPSYRLVGNVDSISEIWTKEGHFQLDLFASRNSPNGYPWQVDGNSSKYIRESRTSITLSFNLETPSRDSIQGAKAVYRIYISQNAQHNLSLSLLIGGNGPSFGRQFSVSQEVSDGIRDVAAVAIMQTIGTALQIPYWRVAPGIFSVDLDLEKGYRLGLQRLTRGDLERKLKRLLVAEGAPMSLERADLDEAETRYVTARMKKGSLIFSDRNQLVEYIVQLWETIDYRAAADRIEARLVEQSRKEGEEHEEAKKQEALKREAAEMQARQSGAESPTLGFFKNKDGRILLKISGVKDFQQRAELLAESQKSFFSACRVIPPAAQSQTDLTFDCSLRRRGKTATSKPPSQPPALPGRGSAPIGGKD